MDAELRKELSDMESRLNTTINSGIKALQDNLTTLFNKDIDYIKIDMSRHDKYHQEHFSDIKELEKKTSENKEQFETKITESRDSILEAVDNKFKEHKEESNTGKDRAWVIIGIIVAALAAIGGYFV